MFWDFSPSCDRRLPVRLLECLRLGTAMIWGLGLSRLPSIFKVPQSNNPASFPQWPGVAAKTVSRG